MNSFSACILSASRDVITEFPRIPPAGGAFIISFGRSPSRTPDWYVIYCHFCTKYELICSINTFCTCIRPYLRTENVQNHVRISFSACILPASPARDVTRSFPASRRPGEYSLYISGVLRCRYPVLYVIYCLFRTEYELICSFNTF